MEDNCNNRLRAVKGDIFDLDEDEYDVAVAFVRHGYNGLSCGLHTNYNHIKESRIAYLIYTNSGNRLHPYFRPMLRLFPSQEAAEKHIRYKVMESLDLAVACGNRIAFHGVQIKGMEVRHNEIVTIETVKEWLSYNPEASVTLVDLYGGFNRHLDSINGK